MPRIAPGERRETCNELDDDCDGLTDEGLAGCASAEDAGPPLPDLGPDLARVEIVFGTRSASAEDAIGGEGCDCATRSAPAPGLVWLFGGLAAFAWRRRTARLGRAGTLAALVLVAGLAACGFEPEPEPAFCNARYEARCLDAETLRHCNLVTWELEDLHCDPEAGRRCCPDPGQSAPNARVACLRVEVCGAP
jgi:MYXO-CTERM domain-containing protein